MRVQKCTVEIRVRALKVYSRMRTRENRCQLVAISRTRGRLFRDLLNIHFVQMTVNIFLYSCLKLVGFVERIYINSVE